MKSIRFSLISAGGAALSATLLLAASALAIGPSELNGRPSAFSEGRTSGAAVYTQGSKLHVLFTGTSKSRMFRGKLCSKVPVSGLVASNLENGDDVRLSPEGKCVWFRFRADGELDGFQIDLPKQLAFFEAREGRRLLLGREIWVGRQGLHPNQTPFSFMSR